MIDLCLVVPHPDDEVFSCGGLFTRMAAQGCRIATVTLTRGGAGRTLGLCAQGGLADLREAELRRSLEILGVDEVHIFDYPDFVTAGDRGLEPRPGLAAVPRAELLERLTALLAGLEPRVIVTFPPNGSNGHPDHVVTSELVRAAWDRLDHPPEELYYFASERPYDGGERPGFLAAEEIRAGHLAPTHAFELGPELATKLRAMGQHESQARSVLGFMRSFPERLLVETFHRARPATATGAELRSLPWLERVGAR